MKDRIRQYRNSEFLKNSFVTVSGTIAAQAIVLLLQPLLRRMYEVETFGYFSVFTALTGIPVVIACFRYELAVMLPRSQKEADNLMVGAFFLNVIFSVLLGIGIWFSADWLTVFLNMDVGFKRWLPAVAPAVFFYANFTLWNNWLVRKKQFGAVNWLKLSRRTSEGLGQVSMASVFSGMGLLLGELLGRFIFNLTGIYFLFKHGFTFKFVKIPTVLRLLKEYVRFPRYSVLPTLLNSAGLLLPAIMFNRLFGKEQTGYFDLSLQMLGVPVMFVVNSLSTVINEQLSSAYRNRESVKPKVMRIFKNLAALGMVFFLFFVLFAPVIFNFVFGEKYDVSGRYAQILAFTFALRMMVYPMAVSFAALDRIRAGSLVQYIHFFMIFGYFFFHTYDDMEWLVGYAILEACLSVIYFFFILWEIRKYEESLKSVI